LRLRLSTKSFSPNIFCTAQDSRNANRQPGKRTIGKIGQKGIDFGRVAGADMVI
jgi:hypothetical protein